MRRFQRINAGGREFMNQIVEKLNEMGYRFVPDSTGGDRDFLMIDTVKEEYIWCENGFTVVDGTDGYSQSG